jgi:hypothetical protein
MSKFSDLTLKDMADAINFLIENPDSINDPAKTNGTKILAWLATNGYITESQLDTYLDDNSYINDAGLKSAADALGYVSTDDLASNEILTGTGAVTATSVQTKLPANYISEYILSCTGSGFGNEADLELIGGSFQCMDSTNSFLMSLTSSLLNQELSGNASDSKYFIFLTYTAGTETYAVESDDNEAGSNLTADYFRLIGMYVTDSAGELWYYWDYDEKPGAFAYLTSPATTVITLADTYQYISGTFENEPVRDFLTNADPAIVYKGEKTRYFEVDWHASVQANIASTTVSVGIKKNGTVVPGSIMATLLKTSSEDQALSGTAVIELAKNDTIQLVCTSDGTGDQITFDHFTTTIREF